MKNTIPIVMKKGSSEGRKHMGWLAVLLTAALSGCAASSYQHADDGAAVPMSGATPVGASLSAFLDNAATGSVSTLAQTPWGPDVSVHARERYFAASGRRCMRLDVSRNRAPASLPIGEIACLIPGKGWYSQRLVTEIIR